MIKPCSKCKNTFDISNFYTTGKLKNGMPKYQSWCKNCIKIKMMSYHKRTWGNDKLQFTAFKRTKNLRSYLFYLLSKAKRRGKCKIDINYLENLWESQQGLCAISKIEMTKILGQGKINTNISIDRIDSDKGYVIGNVQLVCRVINQAKNNLKQIDFINLCKKVAEANNENTCMAA
jgi:hypothetical protein